MDSYDVIIIGTGAGGGTLARHLAPRPPTAEQLVRDVFAEAGEHSILLITHRPEGLDLVDETITLDDGQIAARRIA